MWRELALECTCAREAVHIALRDQVDPRIKFAVWQCPDKLQHLGGMSAGAEHDTDAIGRWWPRRAPHGERACRERASRERQGQQYARREHRHMTVRAPIRRRMRPVPNGLFSPESRIEVLRDAGVPLQSEVHAHIVGGHARRATADTASERPGAAHPTLDSAAAAERAGARSDARREPRAGALSPMPSLESLDPGGESVPAPLHVYIRGWHTVGHGASGWVVYDVLIVLRGVRIVRKRRFSEFVALREALKRERPVRTLLTAMCKEPPSAPPARRRAVVQVYAAPSRVSAARTAGVAPRHAERCTVGRLCMHARMDPPVYGTASTLSISAPTRFACVSRGSKNWRVASKRL